MPILFVSDSDLLINGTDASGVELNEELSNIASWSKIYQLSLNVNNTKFF